MLTSHTPQCPHLPGTCCGCCLVRPPSSPSLLGPCWGRSSCRADGNRGWPSPPTRSWAPDQQRPSRSNSTGETKEEPAVSSKERWHRTSLGLLVGFSGFSVSSGGWTRSSQIWEPLDLCPFVSVSTEILLNLGILWDNFVICPNLNPSLAYSKVINKDWRIAHRLASKLNHLILTITIMLV